MKNVRASILFVSAITFVVLACALHSAEAKPDFDWKDNPKVQAFLETRPAAKRATEGPLGGIIDIIIDIILILVDILLGGSVGPLQLQVSEMKNQLNFLGGFFGGQ